MPGMSSISASAGQNTGRSCFRKATVTGSTVLAFFPEDSGYFGPSGQRAMLNFRVDDLDGLMDALAAAGVQVDPKRETYDDYGKFGWFADPEGNRVELWEPLGPSLESGPLQNPEASDVSAAGLLATGLCGLPLLPGSVVRLPRSPVRWREINGLKVFQRARRGH